MLEGEVGLPAEGGAVALDSVEENAGAGDPLERVEGDQGCAGDQRKEEAGDEAHVVVKREP